jgi:hypothetical protein
VELWNSLKNTGILQLGSGESDTGVGGCSNSLEHIPLTADAIGAFFSTFYGEGYESLPE